MSGQKPRQIAAQVLNRAADWLADTGAYRHADAPEGRGAERTTAPQVTEDAEARAEYVEDLLEHALCNSRLPDVDRRLCQELVYGVVRWRAALDWLIDRKTLSRRPPRRLQNILRLGLYQIFWLDRIPNHAAVNETVELAKSGGFRAQSGFVNALLRGYLREIEATRGNLAELKIKQPEVGFSHPEWLISRWQARWGEESAAALMQWNNTPPKTYARINSLKTGSGELQERLSAEGVQFRAVRRDWFGEEMVFELKSHPQLRELASFRQGLFYVQDPSTLLAVRVLDPRPGDSVLDFCAAPGGKLTHIAQLMRNQGRLVAQETSGQRLKLVRENCARLGVTCAEPVTAFSPAAAPIRTFDRILVDAPCSNTGVMSRRVELRWRIRPEEIERLRIVQIELLGQAAMLLKRGGILVYSTCSIEPEENLGVVEQFLREHKGFLLESQRELLPFRDGVDGAYVARIRMDLGE